MTPTQKRKLLRRYVELQIYLGNDIKWIFGKPLSYFDYDKLKTRIQELEDEYNKQ
jgi:hypothetical protein